MLPQSQTEDKFITPPSKIEVRKLIALLPAKMPMRKVKSNPNTKHKKPAILPQSKTICKSHICFSKAKQKGVKSLKNSQDSRTTSDDIESSVNASTLDSSVEKKKELSPLNYMQCVEESEFRRELPQKIRLDENSFMGHP